MPARDIVPPFGSMSVRESQPREDDLVTCPNCRNELDASQASVQVSDNVISYLWSCNVCGYGFLTKHTSKGFVPDVPIGLALPEASGLEPARQVTEPEADKDEGSEADWLEVKAEVLRLLDAHLLDTPTSHLAYVRGWIKPVLDNDAVES